MTAECWVQARGTGAREDGCQRDCAFGCMCWQYDREEPDYDDRDPPTPDAGTPYSEGDPNACRVCGRDAEFSGWSGVCSRGCHRIEIGLDTP